MTTPSMDYVLVWSKLSTNTYTKDFFVNWIFARHLHKQIAFTRQMHWVLYWHWPCSDLQTEALFSPPILCWEIDLACSFIMLQFLFIFLFADWISQNKLLLRCLTTLFLSLHLLTAVTCIYPTQSNNNAQFRKDQHFTLSVTIPIHYLLLLLEE